jgi:hypothetical protein
MRYRQKLGTEGGADYQLGLDTWSHLLDTGMRIFWEKRISGFSQRFADFLEWVFPIQI